jgi:hypothetical protein
MAFLQQAADLAERFLSIEVAAVALLAQPDGIFVGLDSLSTEIASCGSLAVPKLLSIGVAVKRRREERGIDNEDDQQTIRKA